MASQLQHHVALYPAGTKIDVKGLRVNLLENLAKFKERLSESMKSVLDGSEKQVLIRIVNVGATRRDLDRVSSSNNVSVRELHFCENVLTSSVKCFFLPSTATGGQSEPYLRVGYVASAEGFSQFTYKRGFHADPLIFAEDDSGNIVASITYGDESREMRYLWGKSREPGVDAYLLFSSFLYLRDYRNRILTIHGGLKAEAWCELRNCELEEEVLKRIRLNPHVLRGDREGVILVAGGTESWFFSVPVAPPPLYFLALPNLGRAKKRGFLKMIRHVFYIRERDVLSEALNRVVTKLQIPEAISDDLMNFLLTCYAPGKPVGEIRLLHDYIDFCSRKGLVELIADKFGLVPQCRSFSHLNIDLLLKPNFEKELPWLTALATLVLIDAYLERTRSEVLSIY